MKNNVVLIGMPGAGKSTVGVVLAKLLGFRFLYSDLLIQEAERRMLSEIIAKDGLERFMEIENEINAGIRAENTVIATGGSAVYGRRAMEQLREGGTMVYLRLSFEEICARVGDIRQRGIVLREDQTFRGLYDERCPLYERCAEITVDAEGSSVEELALRIRGLLRQENRTGV